MMSASFKKLHQFKRKKPLYKSRFFWVSFASLLVFLGLVYLVTFASFLQVKRITVVGNNSLTQKEIKKLVEENMTKDFLFAKSNSVLLIETSKVEEELNKKFPVLYDSEVKRGFPDTLKVTVKERKSVGVFSGEKNYLIDKRGIVFQATSSKGNFVISKKEKNQVELGASVIPQSTMNKILTIKSNLEDIKTTKAVLKSKSRLDVITQAGWEVYFDLSKDWKWQISKLKIALEREISETEWKELDYIDLRFDKLYYK